MYEELYKKYNASHYEKPDTIYVVSFWYIPGGTNYSRATICVAYFASLEDATLFKNSINKIYELPILDSLDEYKRHLEKANQEMRAAMVG